MSIAIVRWLAALLLVLWLPACSSEDPIDRPGTWRATGANDWDLRAMVANPSDLVRGEAAATDRGDAGARAITRLLLECRRPLQRETSSRINSAPPEQAEQCLKEGTGAGQAGTTGGALPAAAPAATPGAASP